MPDPTLVTSTPAIITDAETAIEKLVEDVRDDMPAVVAELKAELVAFEKRIESEVSPAKLSGFRKFLAADKTAIVAGLVQVAGVIAARYGLHMSATDIADLSAFLMTAMTYFIYKSANK